MTSWFDCAFLFTFASEMQREPSLPSHSIRVKKHSEWRACLATMALSYWLFK